MEERKIKVLLVNGSPRPNHNTGKALKAAMEGVIEAGAEAELVNLYAIKNLKGCYSCFKCQRKGFDKTDPVCCIKDDTWPVLDKAREADVVIMGSPVYFSYPTGEFRCFYERFLFPKHSYVVEATLVNPKNIGIIFTMNCPENFMAEVNYPVILGENVKGARHVYGNAEALCINNTYQFDDYSQMAVTMFREEEKRAYRDAHFEEDMKRARELGKRLVAQAKARLGC
ncbi:MAG: flavodoxin family protein [Muribaculaceae bacterium]|nr:flavodoxin family protein [Muribaculaceae bacterium]